jgi:hypothetical protein
MRVPIADLGLHGLEDDPIAEPVVKREVLMFATDSGPKDPTYFSLSRECGGYR